METELLSYCFDSYAEGESFDRNRLITSLDLRKASHDELALSKFKLWQPGQELRVSFLDGSQYLHQKVEQYARMWLEHANLEFRFGNFPDPEIRISFRGRGYWSKLGTDAAKAPSYKPTMQFGGFTESTNDLEIQRVVLHEFGHAIGCIHEHSNPSMDIPWDVEKVYSFYQQNQGWGKELVDHNVLKRYCESEIVFSRHDPTSIMQYPVPNYLTRGDYEIGWNLELSAGDKALISKMYPEG